jgi:leucine dehydrogenase
MPVFTSSDFDVHDTVIHCADRASGLRAIIAIHDTTLGAALGGCRMWAYADEAAAERDALRLARGMTYKAAVAGLPFGGGKSVILGDPRRDKSPALIRAFAVQVEALGGRYLMAEDVGTTVADMDQARQVSRFVLGGSGAFGDPSPATARGVLAGIRAAAERRGIKLRGATVAVQGLGKVGMRLALLLHQEGARLLVADVDAAAVARTVREFDATAVPVDAIARIPADVFAPCALGAVLDDASIGTLGAGIVAGSANNQLAEPRHGAMLQARDVLYAPDYVINAGGLMFVAGEALGESPERALHRADGIAETLGEVFRRAEAHGLPTSVVADAMAAERLGAARAGSSVAA